MPLWCRVPWALMALLLSTFSSLRPLVAGALACEDTDGHAPAWCAALRSNAERAAPMCSVATANPLPAVVWSTTVSDLRPRAVVSLPAPSPRLGAARGPRAPSP
jgi:hypothetical protein